MKGKILFVDDEKRVLNSMRGMFRRDYELFLTTEGSEAVSLAAANDIDVIVADQRMPGMTGVEVLEKVRNQSPRTVRILLTGYADPSAIQGSINVGEVFRFLSKPCPPAVLRETLMQAVAASRLGVGNKTPGDSAVDRNAQPVDPVPTRVARQSRPNTQKPGALPAAPATTRAAASTPATSESAPAPLDAARLPAAEPTSVSSAADAPSKSLIDLEKTGVDPDTTGRNPTLLRRATDSAPLGDADPAPAVESTAEARQLAASRRTKINARAVGVVVFSVDQAFGQSVHEIIADDRRVTLTDALPDVADVLEQRQAGVLVTDATADINLLQRMIGALKQHLPELVSIVVSDSRDAEDMINLINYGQVYRYVVKPIDALKLRTDIDAAVLKHLQLLNHPELIQRHQVLDLAQNSATSTTLNRFIGKVTRLRGLWSSSAAKSH